MSIPERRLVTRLRGAMTDAQFLPDEQTDRLVATLADENQRRRQEVGDAINGPDDIRTDIPLVYTTGARRDSLLADAREHVQRLHALAAKLLETCDAVMAQRFGGVEYAIESFLELRAATAAH
jgi:hypothetical protein